MTDPTLERLRGQAIPVIRTGRTEEARRLVGWLRDGGLRVFEITTSVPGWDGLIRELGQDPDLLVGAGTVLDAAAAEAAIAAGSRFLVSPCVVPEVVAAGRSAGLPTVPGAATPTEVLTAHRAGAAAVKLFPIAQLGGPGFLRAVRSVLPEVPLIPTGGIEPEEVRDYLANGALAVGLGSQLAGPTDLERGAREAVVARATRLSHPET